METVQKIPIEKLVIDFNLYPRTQVDSVNVGKLCDAIDAGVILPPIIADKKSFRVTDGVHRLKAYQKKHKPGTKVEVILRTYKSETDLFLDALRLNARHGHQFSPFDIARNLATGRKFKIAPAILCEALSIPKTRYEQIFAKKMAVGNNGDPVALKGTVRHMNGRKITRRQEEAQESLGGANPSFLVNQLLTLIESDMLDEDNKYLVARSGVLVERLTEWLKVARAKQATG